MIAWLVETLIASSGLMALVLVLRQPVSRQFGAKFAYALWLLPALRMVLPPIGSLFPAEAHVNAVTEASGALGAMMRDHLVEQVVTMPALAAPVEAVLTEPDPARWPFLLAALWLGGMLVYLAMQMIGYRRFRRFVLSQARGGEEIEPGIFLVTSPRVRGPMAFGIFRRFIVFPEAGAAAFDEEERRMALAHELAHHVRGDLIANAFALVMLAFHWCNPLAWYAYRAFRTDQEMACDADVLASVEGTHLRHAYGRALVKSACGRQFAAACNLTTVDRLKRRLEMLSSKSLSARRKWIGGLMSGGVVASGLMLTASGQGVAAEVGAKVSDALPMAHVRAMLPAMPALPALPALRAVPAAFAAETRQEAVAAELEQRLARVDMPEPPAPPAPPAAPAPAAEPLPPVPPAPPVPPVPPVAKAPHGTREMVVTINKDGKKVVRHMSIHGPGNFDVDMADIPEVASRECGPAAGKGKDDMVVHEEGRNKRIIICTDRIERVAMNAQKRAMDAQTMAEVHKRMALNHAMASLRSARATIETNESLSDSARRQALASIDEAMREVREGDAQDD